ncbi:MAG: imidazole glycerol phosphate synthase cyclase subunit, partial [Patescibacteria group bacterium]
MLKTRLIPCLLLQDGRLVRSEDFSYHQVIGYPLEEVRRFNGWAVDELIYLDISRGSSHDIGRSDHRVGEMTTTLDILEAIAADCFVPLTFGGRIRTIGDMDDRFTRGADKVAINTAARTDPEFVTTAAQRFGSQAIVVSIDARRAGDGSHEVFADGGRLPTGRTAEAWAREAADRGAGEILLNSIDRDGSGEGYDLELIRKVVSVVDVPVIACGGAGSYEDFAEAVIGGGAAAAAAANIFHF